MDDLFTLLLLVSANVLSQLIIDWFKEIRDDNEKGNDKTDER